MEVFPDQRDPSQGSFTLFAIGLPISGGANGQLAGLFCWSSLRSHQ